MAAIREIPQRELRNNVAEVLRQVQAGERLRVTVRGRAVAELVPIAQRQRFVPRETVAQILSSPLDEESLRADIEDVRGPEDEAVDPWERWSE